MRSHSSNKSSDIDRRKDINEKISRLLFYHIKNEEFKPEDLDPYFNDFILAQNAHYNPQLLKKIQDPLQPKDIERYLNKFLVLCKFQE